MPIYNEAPVRVFAALEAMIEEVGASGLGHAFEWFFLSDTTDPEFSSPRSKPSSLCGEAAWPRLPPVLPAPA